MLFYFLLFRLASICFFFFFFNDTATTEIYTLSLHDALPISRQRITPRMLHITQMKVPQSTHGYPSEARSVLPRSEEHTSELQSPDHLVCRLLLEKKKKKIRRESSNKRHMRHIAVNAAVHYRL